MQALTLFKNSPYVLNSANLFQGLNDQDMQLAKQILADCSIYQAESGEVVIDSQMSEVCMYIILQGTLVLGSTKNRRQLENAAAQFFAGECIGELSVLDEEAYASTIVALTDAQLLAIPANTVWKLIDECPSIARNLLQLLSFRIRTANAQLRSRQKVGEFYRQLSMVDSLTGLYNRAWLNNQFPNMVDEAKTLKHDLSIIMIDLDHFKKFNDEYGHIVGDEALQTAAKAIMAALRPSDFASRFGGEEMMVILPNTNRDSALIVAQRLCSRIRSAKIFDNQDLPHVTASLGLATYQDEIDSLALIAKADAALYRAKERGRDQVAM